jgi:peptidoglycan/xylan/chitin deacetylase (PgdA/CDA1 family)
MEILAERFKLHRVCDLPGVAASEPLESNIACVTFDDGYLDNYESALPVLERLRIKATFFIASGFLGKALPTFAGERAMMTAEHVRELAMLGHEVGAHTVSHPKLAKVPLTTASVEIGGSKRALEDLISWEVNSFAYPNGNYNDDVKALVGSLGFTSAVTTREGLVDVRPDWLALPRVWVNGNPGGVGFEKQVSPATRRYARMKGWRC